MFMFLLILFVINLYALYNVEHIGIEFEIVPISIKSQ